MSDYKADGTFEEVRRAALLRVEAEVYKPGTEVYCLVSAIWMDIGTNTVMTVDRDHVPRMASIYTVKEILVHEEMLFLVLAELAELDDDDL